MTWLKQLRIDRGFSQKEIAEKLELKPQQFGRYENGKNEIPLKTAVKLAKIYDVTLEYLASADL